MNDIIKYSGLKSLTADEEGVLKNIVEKEYPRIQRLFKNGSDLIVAVKTQKKDTKKRFSISMRLEAPGRIFSTKNKDTEKGGDWDLAKVTHKEINALYSEVKHHIEKDSDSWRKGGIRALIKKFQS